MYTIASPEALAQAVHDLAAQESGADLSAVRSAIDEIEAGRVRALLKATADLEAAKTDRGRRFIVAYYYKGKAKTARGVAYVNERAKKTTEDDECEAVKGHGVIVDDYDAPFYNRYDSVADFERRLSENYRLQYVIRYID